MCIRDSYGIMASAVKHNIELDSKACIESAAKSFLSGMSWKGFTDFKQECVTSWTKLFATNEVCLLYTSRCV